MLVPNDHQQTRLFQFAGTARFAYNWALLKEKTAFESGEKFISSNDLRKEFSLLRNSSEYQCLNWWLPVSVEFESAEAENFSDGLGIDLGIKNLAVCSDGTTYSNINQTSTVKNLKKKQRRLQRSISRRYRMNNKKGESYSKTRNIIKSEKKLLKIYH